MNLDAAMQTFIAESRELLAGMEDALLTLEQEPDNSEAIAAAFRAVHTIKGSGGLFGLDRIVGFAHLLENLMDLVRAGERAVTPSVCDLLLASADHLNGLLDCALDGSAFECPAVDPNEESLMARLSAAIGEQVENAAPMELRQPSPTASGGGPVTVPSWHISIRFGRDLLRHGMDPASFLRYLTTLGEIVAIYTVDDAMPSAAEMDPETCYLGFEIMFKTEANKDTLVGVFEFVSDCSQIYILPSDSKIEEYRALIDSLPEPQHRIGEILIACGAVTRAELEAALALQTTGSQGTPLGEILVQQGATHPAVVQAALERQNQARDRRSTDSRYVRVDASKLEALINQVGELVIASASASLISRANGDGGMLEAMSQVERMVEEIRDTALALRMVEIGDTFQRFRRIVRDASAELGKDIELQLSGTDTELDKTVIEKITDPLTHLVRNAIDHGIEPAAERIAAGKPAQGNLHLSAHHDAGSIIIEVSDDGGGLNRERIMAKAVERGLVAAGTTLRDEEIDQLIFEPGFSTAAEITNLSGRGVGMDVVKRNVTALRGTIHLASRPGQGTTVSIRLPLTMAIIDGFLFQVGSSSFVVPLDNVMECLELPEDEKTHDRDYLYLRGEVLPYVRLRQVFTDPSPTPLRENVVVVKVGGHKAGLVVDRLLGEFQTVIKPLGKLFRQLPGISGSTILGSGEVALILDVSALVQRAVTQQHDMLARGSSLSQPRVAAE